MSERKHPIEVTEDGRFILDQFIYSELTLENLGSRNEIKTLREELERTRNGIKHYQEENERLHTLLLNLTSRGRINNSE